MTNKPGSVNQQPLYGCINCYEDCTLPADDLRVFGSECWCDLCWDERRWEFPEQPSWNDLEPYTPALQAECEKLRELVTECADYLDTNDMTSIGHGSVLHRRLLDAAHRNGGEV